MALRDLLVQSTGPTREKLKGKAVETAGSLIGTAIATRKTDADRYNIDRIAELQRMQEMNALGLTEQEKGLLESQYAGQLSSIGREGESRRRQQMAAQDIFGGAALEQAGLTDQALASARVDATAAITEADINRRRQMEEELIKRQQIEDKRLEDKRGAYGKIVVDRTKELSTLFSEKTDEEGQIDPLLITAVKTKFGYATDLEAKSAIIKMSKDPELAVFLKGVDK
jgi:hypothetical protein